MKRLSIILLLLLVLITSCAPVFDPPETVYKQYSAACNSGDLASAASLMTEEGKAESKKHGGYCGLHPDGRGTPNLAPWKLDPPKITIAGNTAYLDFRITGAVAINRLTFFKESGAWKINAVRIFQPQD